MADHMDADDLHDRTLPGLDRLLTTAVPPLAPADLIRRRGAQRRARSRGLAAGALLGVVLLGSGTALALSSGGGGGRESLGPAAPVTSSTVPTPSPVSPSPAQSPATTPPSSVAAAPSAATPSAAAPSADPRIPAEALLTPAQLGEYWVRGSSSRGPVEPALNPCGSGLPDAAAVVAHLSGRYEMRDADGPILESSVYDQQVVRYATPEKARAAAADLRAAVTKCAITTDGDFTTTRTVVDEAPLLVELGSAYAGQVDNPPWFQYAGVSVRGDLLTTWSLEDSHGISREQADRTADRVEKSLCKASDRC